MRLWDLFSRATVRSEDQARAIPIDRLPREIRLRIAEKLDAKDLCALCLTNRRWAQTAQQALYEDITIKEASQSTSLRSTLHRKPRLGECVRKLDLPNYGRGNFFVSELLQLCSRLVTLRTGWNIASAGYATVVLPDHISELQLDDCSIDLLLVACCQLRNLRSLTLVGESLGALVATAQLAECKGLAANLIELHLDLSPDEWPDIDTGGWSRLRSAPKYHASEPSSQVNGPTAYSLAEVLTASTTSLRALSIKNFPLHWMTTCLENAKGNTQLAQLEFESYFHMHVRSGKGRPDPQHSLGTDFVTSDGESRTALFDAIRAYPSLRRLVLGAQPNDTEDYFDYMRQRADFTTALLDMLREAIEGGWKMQSVELGADWPLIAHQWAHEDRGDPDERGSPELMAKIRALIRQTADFKTFCEGRGIQLV